VKEMKMKFIDPDQIFSAVLALIILGVGVFATFVVFGSIPTTVPMGVGVRTGNGTLGPAAPGLSLNNNNTEPLYIPTPNAINNTGVCILYGNNNGSMYVHQAVGACNGTFMANGTYRVTGGTFKRFNHTIHLHYATTGQVTAALSNATYNAVLNVSSTANQVFNIIGVVLIIAAIMAIVGLVYSYIKPRM